MKKRFKPDFDGELDEFQRMSQDLMRDEDIDISVDNLVNVFKKTREATLNKDIWSILENTESNEIEKGDFAAVEDVAKKYNKTSPKILAKAIKSGDYERPLIVKIGDRYVLMAGNTRLCTAAAMGVTLNVFIGDITNLVDPNKLSGGNADHSSLVKIAKKHDAKSYYHIEDMVKYIKKELQKGIKIEMEHTNDKEMAKEIAMDHLWEDPNYYIKLDKMEKETNEMTDSGSSGSFVSAFSTLKTKGDVKKIYNAKLTEATDSSTSSAGAYDAPFTPNKDPLKINGEKSIAKSRAVKDKKFPKWGGPGGVFVKIKDKCKKFPYCNQGINAIEILREIDGMDDLINENAKKYGLSIKEVENLLSKEIKQIFI